MPHGSYTHVHSGVTYNIYQNNDSYLLSTRVVRASPSTSSATITSGFLCALASSRAGTICWIDEIFFWQRRTKQSWNSTFCPEKKKQIVIGLRWPLFNGCNINNQTLSKRQRWSNFKLINWHCVRNNQVVDNYLHWKMWPVNVTFHCNKTSTDPLNLIT